MNKVILTMALAGGAAAVGVFLAGAVQESDGMYAPVDETAGLACEVQDVTACTEDTTAACTENTAPTSGTDAAWEQKKAKADLYYHCLNTLEFLDRLSGTVTLRNGNQFPCTTTGAFIFDFTNEKFYASQTDYAAYTGEVAGVYEFYNDHGHVLSKFDYRDVDLGLEEETPPERVYWVRDNGPTMDGIVFPEESGNIYSTMYRDPTNAHMLAGCFIPQEMSVGYLKNYDNWEIAESTECQGRQCAVIRGVADDDYGKRFGVSSFEIIVDKETGIWMQYEGYDACGTVQDYIYTSDLRFGDAVGEIPDAADADVTGYRKAD